jgi:DNA-binding NarL/FixJ family response regulator
MKVLLLEDHSFFASDLIEYFKEETDFELTHVKTYKEAMAALSKNKYDFSILDVILQNGKTGLDVAKASHGKLGKIMFLTGCCDSTTLEALREYVVVSKLELIWPKLEMFLNNQLLPLKSMRDSDSGLTAITA